MNETKTNIILNEVWEPISFIMKKRTNDHPDSFLVEYLSKKRDQSNNDYDFSPFMAFV